ncbi:MAG: DUF3795 domain-containing protein [Chloroflexota bacterium]
MSTNLAKKDLVAPCGINCRLCYAFIREKNHCPGCRGDDFLKMKSCLACKIKNCEKFKERNYQYCFECDDFPCSRLKHLDKRYRTKYGTSVIENLDSIKNNGVNEFVISDQAKWTCPECGGMLCMHKPECFSCGYLWNN